MKAGNRICIYPKDVQRITGKSERYARRLLKAIKKHFKKQDHHFVTIDEFSQFTGIPLEVIGSLY